MTSENVPTLRNLEKREVNKAPSEPWPDFLKKGQ